MLFIEIADDIAYKHHQNDRMLPSKNNITKTKLVYKGKLVNLLNVNVCVKRSCFCSGIIKIVFRLF